MSAIAPAPVTSTAIELSSKSKHISLSQQIKNLANQKLDNGYELKDSDSTNRLKKIIIDELKINPNSKKMVRDGLKSVFTSRNLQISDLGFKNGKIGDTIVNIIKQEVKPDTAAQIQNNTNLNGSPVQNNNNIHGNNRGSLPTETERQESSQIPQEKKVMSASAQEKLIKNSLSKIIAPLYIAMGIVTPDESEVKEESKPQTAKAFRQDMDDLGTELSNFLTENNIQLPQFLNFLAIGLSIFMVLILPVIKFKFFSVKQDAKPSYDVEADEVEVKV